MVVLRCFVDVVYVCGWEQNGGFVLLGFFVLEGQDISFGASSGSLISHQDAFPEYDDIQQAGLFACQ